MLAACRPALTKQELSSQVFNRVVVFEGDKNAFLPSNFYTIQNWQLRDKNLPNAQVKIDWRAATRT
jgi:hypothetical protein